MGNLPQFFTHAAPLGALGARELRCQRRAEVRFRVTVFDQLFFAPVTISGVFLACVGVTKRQ